MLVITCAHTYTHTHTHMHTHTHTHTHTSTVCLGLIWDSDQPSVDYIMSVLEAIGLKLRLTDVS